MAAGMSDSLGESEQPLLSEPPPEWVMKKDWTKPITDEELRQMKGIDHEKGWRAIQVAFRVWRVFELNTAAQTFKIYFVLNVVWFDENMAPKITNDTLMNPIDHQDVLGSGVPKLRFENMLGGPDIMMHWLSSHASGVCEYEMWVIGEFMDPVSAADFPFDAQDFSIDIRLMQRPPHEDSFLVPLRGSFVCVDNQFLPEWDIHGFSQLVTWSSGAKSYRSGLLCWSNEERGWHARCIFTFFAVRNPKFFQTNIMMLSSVIGLLGLTSFAIEKSDISDRLAFNVTLMLTEVALKFASADSLPKVSYVTALDIKVYMVFWLLGILMAMQSLQTSFDPDAEFISDTTMFFLYLACVLASEAVMFFWWVMPYHCAYQWKLGHNPAHQTPLKWPKAKQLSKLIQAARRNHF